MVVDRLHEAARRLHLDALAPLVALERVFEVDDAQEVDPGRVPVEVGRGLVFGGLLQGHVGDVGRVEVGLEEVVHRALALFPPGEERHEAEEFLERQPAPEGHGLEFAQPELVHDELEDGVGGQTRLQPDAVQE